MSGTTADDGLAPAPKSIIIVGAGVFGLSTAYSLLCNSRYDNTEVTILDQWSSSTAADRSGVTPASIDNSRITREDYANKAYARLALRAQRSWRAGWPLNLPSASTSTSTAATPSQEQQQKFPYRESGLLITCWEKKKDEVAAGSDDVGDPEGDLLNPGGAYYVDTSLANLREMTAQDAEAQARVEVLTSAEQVSARLLTGGKSGDRGYLNKRSGWADNGAAMAVLRARTHELVAARNAPGSSKAPAIFIEGDGAYVESLTFSAERGDQGLPVVTGVRIASPPNSSSGGDDEEKTLAADLVVLAAGAWSPRLLPRTLGSRIKATGQVMGYVRLTDDEARRLADMPVPINMSSGLFAFPPIAAADGKGHIMKVARHGWGYANRVRVPDVEAASGTGPPSRSGETVEVQLPAPGSGSVIGAEGASVLARFLGELGLPPRPWDATRTCWYADTATCDWLVDYPPNFGAGSLFVATGGSGHGFKFAPVVGDWIVRAIERRLGGDPDGGPDAELGALLADSWRWRSDEEDRANWNGPGDGSRAGPKGMIWQEEIEKGAVGAGQA